MKKLVWQDKILPLSIKSIEISTFGFNLGTFFNLNQ
jgi:hypothetical protein